MVLKSLLLYWLVISTHLKNISQNGNLPHIGVNIKKYWKPPPSKSITWRIIPWLGYVVNHHGDPLRPLRIGLWYTSPSWTNLIAYKRGRPQLLKSPGMILQAGITQGFWHPQVLRTKLSWPCEVKVPGLLVLKATPILTNRKWQRFPKIIYTSYWGKQIACSIENHLHHFGCKHS